MISKFELYFQNITMGCRVGKSAVVLTFTLGFSKIVQQSEWVEDVRAEHIENFSLFRKG